MEATSGYTRPADFVIADVQRIAKNRRHNFVGTEHILLALLESNQGMASQVFNRLEVDREKMRKAVDTTIPAGEKDLIVGKVLVDGEIPWTPRAKKVMEYAVIERDKDNAEVIGTDHVLLGLFLEHSGVAQRVLRDSGIFEEDVRAALTAASTAKVLEKVSEVTQLSKDIPSPVHVDRVAYFIHAVLQRVPISDMNNIVEESLSPETDADVNLINYCRKISGQILEGI